MQLRVPELTASLHFKAMRPDAGDGVPGEPLPEGAIGSIETMVSDVFRDLGFDGQAVLEADDGPQDYLDRTSGEVVCHGSGPGSPGVRSYELSFDPGTGDLRRYRSCDAEFTRSVQVLEDGHLLVSQTLHRDPSFWASTGAVMIEPSQGAVTILQYDPNWGYTG
ncbi:MAG: hypothetical protein AB1758_29435 [Candidatus Eremiobacterota bacterium]